MGIELSLDIPSGDTTYNVIIIGGGPAGLSAAIYAARARLQTVVLDRNPAAGALARTEKIANYPGIPKALTGKGLLAIMREQAEFFGATVLERWAIGVDFASDPKKVFTGEGTYLGQAIIIATGAMGRKPTLKGEAEFIGRGVAYCAVCDAAFFKDREVAVVGEPEVVREEVELLAKYARRIHLLTPRKVSPQEAEFLSGQPRVELIEGLKVMEILGSSSVEALRLADAQANEQTIPVDGVFVYLHGSSPIVDFLLGAVELSSEGCIAVNKEDMSTSIPGVYAIGDVTCKRVRQAVLSAAEGCTAALSANAYLNRHSRVASQWH